jgi:hypothetical protein
MYLDTRVQTEEQFFSLFLSIHSFEFNSLAPFHGQTESPQNRITVKYLYNKQVLVAWLVGDHLLLRDIEPYGIIFMLFCENN